MNKIASFSGEYRFLSNFWPAKIWYQDILYPSTEHAYQAAKTLVQESRLRIAKCATPGQAKRLGQLCKMRADWEEVKIDVMLTVLRLKFQDKELAQKLLATAPKILEEGNTWGDTFWGICRGQGQNNLGKLLMQVRDEINTI